MEISFETGDSTEVVGNVAECERSNGAYRLELNSGSKIRIDGEIIGVIAWSEYIPQINRYDTEKLAIKLKTDGILNVPTRPLKGNCSVEGDWVYEDGFDFGFDEIEPSDGVCILRNVSSLTHPNAKTASSTDSTALKLKTGNGGFKLPCNTQLSHCYQASFGSGWLSVKLNGEIDRITAYNQRDVDILQPTEETAQQVSWAFDDN